MKIKRLFLLIGIFVMMVVFYNTFIKDEHPTNALIPIK
ncbi:Oligopeptide ABC transporter, ATP-binding protein [Bacillus cereus Rock3-28]|nr:Oligopeptide ABC transporter, ATP-binding protein [Bacillus cereus Rock3-28]